MMYATGGFPDMKDDKPHRSPNEPLDIKELLDATLLKLHISSADPYVNFCMNWQQLIGSKLYPHIKPVDVKNGTLILRSDHPSWSSIVMMQKKQIISKVQKKYPALGIISLQIVSQ